MKIPASVKIGNHIYKIRQVENLSDEEGRYLGWNQRTNLDIAVEEGLPDSMKLEVLQHEINHGLFNGSPIYHHKDNEDIVVSLTGPLIEFIADNPEYIRFIQKEVKRVRNQGRIQEQPRRSPRTATGKRSEPISADQPERKPRRSRNPVRPTD